MTERELFLAVLELSDPQARERYLDQASAGQAALAPRFWPCSDRTSRPAISSRNLW